MRAANRRGYVLVAVLWTIAGAAVLGFGLAEMARNTTGAAQNRVSLIRAQWAAEGCAEIAKSAINEALESTNAAAASSGAGQSWLVLDSIVRESSISSSCDVHMQSSGTRINVNSDDVSTVRGLLIELGIDGGQADSLLDALSDWRDADDASRPYGAERDWYRANRRRVPRNGALAAIEELHLVRGFENVTGIDSLLGVDSARIDIGRAPPLVLGALPGMSPEAVQEIVALRAAGIKQIDLAAVAGSLTPGARSLLLAHYAEVAGRTTSSPDAWTLTARASTGQPPVTSSIELRFANAGKRVAVVRRRAWP